MLSTPDTASLPTYYFKRTSESTLVATTHTGGAWNTDEQHIAPALGLATHIVEQHRMRRHGDAMSTGRLSFDILGTMPVGEIEASLRVLRPGNTIELVEATLGHAGRAALVARAWLIRKYDTAPLAHTHFPALSPREELPAWDPTTVWPGGFIASAEVRRHRVDAGRAMFWVRTPVALVANEDSTPLARAIGLLDIANGMTERLEPAEILFPNLDLTAHMFAEPDGEWIGFDTTVSIGADGIGLTHSIIHDHRGPIGTSSQILTVRPMGKTR
ncbi:thioesterase family protein [Aldersonia sp. NBC_00410]|uniref:thioesterase family protein n=1 Tax=Aldersonia sp. NBC_00410 TaxID=2975954 RepID=UPI00225B5FC2|nr:thioesterase family protein [Aldersonia sp. NBC_00410]MCX5044153.1 thioesterase family protein [Aldersonia sp. NBC_00410]